MDTDDPPFLVRCRRVGGQMDAFAAAPLIKPYGNMSER
jgi:hypothetical protein